MANAFFCNCVADKISVNLNGELTTTALDPRTAQLDTSTNRLPMHAFLIVQSEAETGKFGKLGDNTVTIRFNTLKATPNTFDIQVDKRVEDQDLFFYVYENTLVGQDQVGHSTGVSIHMHETVKRTIQSGVEEGTMRSLPIDLFELGDRS